MSGPYALEAFGDALFLGSVDIGSTKFAPLYITSYQEAYGNIYTKPTDIYEPQYAPNMFELLPSTTPIATLFASGALPANRVVQQPFASYFWESTAHGVARDSLESDLRAWLRSAESFHQRLSRKLRD